MYPSPSSNGTVKLELGSLDSRKSYSILVSDIMGRKAALLSGTPRNLEQAGSKSISQLKAGVYVLNVYDQKKVVITNKILRY